VIRFRAAAARELAADVRYYDKQYPGRGQRLAAPGERAMMRVTESPLALPLLIEPDIRSVKVERFPYRAVYLATARTSTCWP
jgi:hypothetical protein